MQASEIMTEDVVTVSPDTLRWERDLKPRGSHLAARVLDFPHGMPGGIGLFPVWRD